MVLWSVEQVLMVSGTERNMKLKMSMSTYLTQIKPMLDYYHASVSHRSII